MESIQLSSKISDLDLTDILTTYDDGSRSAVMSNALTSAAVSTKVIYPTIVDEMSPERAKTKAGAHLNLYAGPAATIAFDGKKLSRSAIRKPRFHRRAGARVCLFRGQAGASRCG